MTRPCTHEMMDRLRSGDKPSAGEIVAALDLDIPAAFHAAAGAMHGIIDDAVRLAQIAGLDERTIVLEASKIVCGAPGPSSDFRGDLSMTILVGILAASVSAKAACADHSRP